MLNGGPLAALGRNVQRGKGSASAETNVDRFHDSTDPDIRKLLGRDAGLGRFLGLDDLWAYNVIRQVMAACSSRRLSLGRAQASKKPRCPFINSLLKRMDSTMAYKPDSTTARGFVVQSDDAPGFWQLGSLWRVMATGLQTGNSFCLLDQLVMADGGGPCTHAHTQDEGLYVVSGHCTFHTWGLTIAAGPGEFVAVPRYGASMPSPWMLPTRSC